MEGFEMNYELFEEITKDNILEVLKYNGVDGGIDKDYDSDIKYISIVNKFTYDFFISLSSPNWLQHLELEAGKLKPLPKQPKDLLEWWDKNKVKGVGLEKCGEYYQIITLSWNLAVINKKWDLSRQIDAVQKLIEIYKEEECQKI